MMGTQHKSILFLIILVWLILKLSLLNYGLPYQFHPDEASIIKDPLKILYNYARLDFSSSTNLFYWFTPLWYGILFLGGYIIGYFESFSAFNELIVAEDSVIWIWARTLSFLLSALSLLFIYKTLSLLKNINPFVKILLFATVIFNPLELMSNMWAKMDAIAYFYSTVVIYYLIRYFLQKDISLKKIFLLLFIGVSIRIDLIAFVIAFVVTDFYHLKYTNIFKYLGKVYKYIILGLVIYCCITLLPIKFIYETFHSQKTGIIVEKSLTEIIFTKSTNKNLDTAEYSSYINSLYSFLMLGLLSLGIPFFHLFIKSKQSILFITIILVLLIPSVLVKYVAAHYFLLLSIIILFTYTFSSYFDNITRFKYIYLSFNLIVIFSFSVQFAYSLSFSEDTRLEAKKYLLNNTGKEDVILIEELINPGFYPPIDECPDVLREKARVTRENFLGTGKTLDAFAKKSDSLNCRQLIGLSDIEQFPNTDYKNVWHITKDTSLFNSVNAKYFVSIFNYTNVNGGINFEKIVDKNYKLDKLFAFSYNDFRLNKVVFTEGAYFPSIYVYRKK